MKSSGLFYLTAAGTTTLAFFFVSFLKVIDLYPSSPGGSRVDAYENLVRDATSPAVEGGSVFSCHFWSFPRRPTLEMTYCLSTFRVCCAPSLPPSVVGGHARRAPLAASRSGNLSRRRVASAYRVLMRSSGDPCLPPRKMGPFFPKGTRRGSDRCHCVLSVPGDDPLPPSISTPSLRQPRA